MHDKQSKLLYFAYGEHMNENEMKRVFPYARQVGKAYIKGYTLCFIGRDGVARAGTQACAEGHLPGCVWSLPLSAADILDRMMGVPVFTRREIHPVLLEGIVLPVLVYISIPGQRYGRPGFITYDLLREAYATVGENPDAIKGLAMQCAP